MLRITCTKIFLDVLVQRPVALVFFLLSLLCVCVFFPFYLWLDLLWMPALTYCWHCKCWLFCGAVALHFFILLFLFVLRAFSSSMKHPDQLTFALNLAHFPHPLSLENGQRYGWVCCGRRATSNWLALASHEACVFHCMQLVFWVTAVKLYLSGLCRQQLDLLDCSLVSLWVWYENWKGTSSTAFWPQF